MIILKQEIAWQLFMACESSENVFFSSFTSKYRLVLLFGMSKLQKYWDLEYLCGILQEHSSYSSLWLPMGLLSTLLLTAEYRWYLGNNQWIEIPSNDCSLCSGGWAEGMEKTHPQWKLQFWNMEWECEIVWMIKVSIIPGMVHFIHNSFTNILQLLTYIADFIMEWW